jgi:hypothetical protein
MISPIAATDKYILQPTLFEKHRKTLDWLSSALLWKREMAFFQKLLDQYAAKFSALEDKKRIDHFQHLITYYNGEVIDGLRAKLRMHEKNLAEVLQKNDELNTQYFNDHDELMKMLEAANTQVSNIKAELFNFIEKAM